LYKNSSTGRKDKKMKNRISAVIIACILIPFFAVSVVSWGASYKAIDLHPSGFDESYTLGISGTQQVGLGWGLVGPGSTYRTHALLGRRQCNELCRLELIFAGWLSQFLGCGNRWLRKHRWLGR
jgi:hypothetical protein